MNKYQEALERLENITSVPSIFINEVVKELVVTFKELVDKEIPMKPNKKNLSSYCSTCGGYVGEGKNYAWAMEIVYCKKCGQKIDWSE